MLAAVVWALMWVVGRWKDKPVTVPTLAMLLALISLVLEAILGVLLGLFIANGSLPGFSATTATNLGSAHPAAMLVGYLILAGTAVAEWRLSPRPVLASESKVGVAIAFGLFVSGLLFNVAMIGEVEALTQVASMLEVIGVVAFIVPDVGIAQTGGMVRGRHRCVRPHVDCVSGRGYRTVGLCRATAGER